MISAVTGGNPHERGRLRLIFSLLFIAQSKLITAKFEPYQNNGGLITAIAGKDYILLASDTRLSDGYEIKSRSHLSSRIWNAQATVPSTEILDRDGSIRIPSSIYDENLEDKVRMSSPEGNPLVPFCDHDVDCDPPIFVGSCGCAADCIALQRQFRSETSAYTYWTGGSGNTHLTTSTTRLTPRQISILLMNTLYHRRSFPFYSFCVVAGLNTVKINENDNDDVDGDDHGAVYVYDAIGSNERVAVAAVGTGREMMQPILDRLLATSNSKEAKFINLNDTNTMKRDSNAVAAQKQKRGNTLLPPVNTYVSCDIEEAVDLLMRGYRSVAEREIGVGDDVIVCLLKRKPEGGHTMEIRRFPLRKH